MEGPAAKALELMKSTNRPDYTDCARRDLILRSCVEELPRLPRLVATLLLPVLRTRLTHSC